MVAYRDFDRKVNMDKVELEKDMEKLKEYYMKSRNKTVKDAYYKLWYALVVMKHQGML